jgi:phage terminase large subunit GpA-like protein
MFQRRKKAVYPIDALVREALALLRPPAKLTLSDWAEENFVLAETSSAKAGRFRLWPYQREILDAIGDPQYERVTVIKSARVGYTKCLMAGIGATAAIDPCSMILLVPTDDDARGYAVDEVEPAFSQSPSLNGLIRTGRVDGRNTLTMKSITGGGSLKILSARSPRNLRRHDAKKLFIDEEDGMEVTSEGDPIMLAEKRTLAHPDRKIVRGSTPTDELTSSINRAYEESDQRIYEIACPMCGCFFELQWEMIVWPSGEPDKAACACPHCSELIEESHKATMVGAGRWRRMQPDVKSHAGFRLSTLLSLLVNARWGKLAEEFLRARRAGPAEMQVFVNTVLGRVWKHSLDEIDEQSLAARVENFGLKQGEDRVSRFPREVLAITAGVDTQDDRFEITIWGWNDSQAFVLGHFVVWGCPRDAPVQAELDRLLRTTWLHPNGWRIGIDATAIDSAGHFTQAIYDFCGPRLSRRIYPIIGRSGTRRVWEASKRRKGGARLFVVGIDQLKTEILQRLPLPLLDENKGPMPGAIRLSNDLPEDWFEQIVGVRRVVRYVRNRAVIEFRPRKAGQREEVFDCAVYAFAARYSLRINFAERRARTSEKMPTRSIGSMLASANNPETPEPVGYLRRR